MTAIPNQHWGGENRTSVLRFVTSIVGWPFWLVMWLKDSLELQARRQLCPAVGSAGWRTAQGLAG